MDPEIKPGLIPSSEFSMPDLDLCAGSATWLFQCCEIWPTTYPQKKVQGESPLSPDPVPWPPSEGKAQWSSLEPSGHYRPQWVFWTGPSWNFLQMFCFQPVSHQVCVPWLKPKKWNLSCLRWKVALWSASDTEGHNSVSPIYECWVKRVLNKIMNIYTVFMTYQRWYFNEMH